MDLIPLPNLQVEPIRWQVGHVDSVGSHVPRRQEPTLGACLVF